MEPLYQVQIVCPCCGMKFQTSRARPSFKKPVRTDSDFCGYYQDVNPDYYIVRVCPTCGFASTENSIGALSEKQKASYYDKIGSKWKPRSYAGERSAEQALECYKLALLCAQAVGEKERVVASLLHHIAWLYRYDGKAEEERRFMRFAAEAYVRVFESDRDGSSARIMYLIGELHRRLGDYHEAVRWFSRVVNDKRIMDAAMIKMSRDQWQVAREEMLGQGLDLPEEMERSGAS